MAKYLFEIALTRDGVQGLIREGGTSRRAAIEKLVNASGGTVEAYYFSFGETDTFVIVDLPDNQTAAAISLAVSASGAAQPKVTVLITPEQVDQAARKTISYRPPGA